MTPLCSRTTTPLQLDAGDRAAGRHQANKEQEEALEAQELMKAQAEQDRLMAAEKLEKEARRLKDEEGAGKASGRISSSLGRNGERERVHRG